MHYGTMMKKRMMKAGNMTPSAMKKGMMKLDMEDDKMEAEEEYKAQQEELMKKGKMMKMKKKMFQANK